MQPTKIKNNSFLAEKVWENLFLFFSSEIFNHWNFSSGKKDTQVAGKAEQAGKNPPGKFFCKKKSSSWQGCDDYLFVPFVQSEEYMSI